jgi:hypothetical protein
MAVPFVSRSFSFEFLPLCVFASLRLCVFASLRLCVFASLRLCVEILLKFVADLNSTFNEIDIFKDL